jgi:hypothetical protein
MQFDQLKRREFITLLGGAAAGWPLVARAQQPIRPTIGFLGTASVGGIEPLVEGFRRGLAAAGLAEGKSGSTRRRENRLRRAAAVGIGIAAQQCRHLRGAGHFAGQCVRDEFLVAPICTVSPSTIRGTPRISLACAVP